MKRRDVMATAATLALGMVWSSVAARSSAAGTAIGSADIGAEDEVAALADHLFQAFPQPRSLQVIGDAFRRDQAGSTSARGTSVVCGTSVVSGRETFQRFLHHLDLSKADLQDMTPAAVRSHIDRRTAKDFVEGRIISVEGWLLGETEARLCEVASLRTT